MIKERHEGEDKPPPSFEISINDGGGGNSGNLARSDILGPVPGFAAAAGQVGIPSPFRGYEAPLGVSLGAGKGKEATAKYRNCRLAGSAGTPLEI